MTTSNRKIIGSIIIIIISGISIISLKNYFKKSPDSMIISDCNIVNEKNHIYRGQCLPENFTPQYLVKLSPRASYLNTEKYVDIRTKLAAEQMILDAEKDGVCLIIMAGYRSREYQEKLSDTIDKTLLAKPGQSEHQTGLAVDLGACPMKNNKRDDAVERLELRKPFKELPEYEWLKRNAKKYDFEQSFREDNQNESGYPEEPWHWKLILK